MPKRCLFLVVNARILQPLVQGSGGVLILAAAGKAARPSLFAVWLRPLVGGGQSEAVAAWLLIGAELGLGVGLVAQPARFAVAGGTLFLLFAGIHVAQFASVLPEECPCLGVLVPGIPPKTLGVILGLACAIAGAVNLVFWWKSRRGSGGQHEASSQFGS